MTIEARLLALLCCPNCGAELLDLERSLKCTVCTREYPVCGGIPDLRVYATSSHNSKLNEEQARHEEAVHDVEASADYERYVVRVFGTKTRLVAEAWTKELSEAGCSTVLDYGCGTGQLSRVLCRRFSPLFAFDISQASVRKNVDENGVTGILANAFFLPFKDRSFDAVCVNGVLHHIVDLDRAIEELSRVARKHVSISEGIPRGRPSLARTRHYRHSPQRALYTLYVLVWLAYVIPRKLVARVRRWAGITQAPRIGSEYERPLSMSTVASRLQAHGFHVHDASFLTNIDIPGDGRIKRWLTERLRDESFGTHFDLRVSRPNVELVAPRPEE